MFNTFGGRIYHTMIISKIVKKNNLLKKQLKYKGK